MSDKIHIKADFINLNGIIQSGKADYGLVFGAATTQRINDIILSGATGKINKLALRETFKQHRLPTIQAAE